jgi:hypothetical protein
VQEKIGDASDVSAEAQGPAGSVDGKDTPASEKTVVDGAEVTRGRAKERKAKARFEDDEDDEGEEAHRHGGMIME